MPIARVLAFGLFIVILRIMLPDVLSEARQTTLALLLSLERAAERPTSFVASPSLSNDPSPPDPSFVLPHAPLPIITE